MAAVATINDVFTTAIGMERIGGEFYQALALASDDAKVREFCLRAANDEAMHLQTFRQMRLQWVRPDGPRVNQSTAYELAELAKSQIQPSPRMTQHVAINGTLKDALTMAVVMEQDAIRFYQGLLNLMPVLAGPLQAVIAQEKRHLQSLKIMAT